MAKVEEFVKRRDGGLEVIFGDGNTLILSNVGGRALAELYRSNGHAAYVAHIDNPNDSGLAGLRCYLRAPVASAWLASARVQELENGRRAAREAIRQAYAAHGIQLDSQ